MLALTLPMRMKFLCILHRLPDLKSSPGINLQILGKIKSKLTAGVIPTTRPHNAWTAAELKDLCWWMEATAKKEGDSTKGKQCRRMTAVCRLMYDGALRVKDLCAITKWDEPVSLMATKDLLLGGAGEELENWRQCTFM
jgi:hypothetical protein